MRPFSVVLALALVTPLAVAASLPCSVPELSIRDVVQAGSYGSVSTDSSCFTQRDVLAPGIAQVDVEWFHDAPGLADLTVVLDGPGVHQTLALTEGALSDGTTYYASPAIDLPAGFSGTLTATLFHGIQQIDQNSASTLR